MPSQVSLTAAEKAWLASHSDEIALWHNTDMPPFEFLDESGRFIGLAADVFTLVEEKLGITVRKAKNNNWTAHLKALKTGESAMAPAIVRTPERDDYIFFTDPYLNIPVVIIGTASSETGLSLDTLAEKKIAVARGSAEEGFLNRHTGKKLNIVPVKDVLEGLTMVAFGQVEAYVGSLAVASYHIIQEGITNLKVIGTTEYSHELRIGVSKQYPLLFSAVQKAVAAISEPALSRIRQKWIALKIPHGLSAGTIRILVSTGIFLGLLILGLTTISFFLKRRLNEKIVRLEQSRQEAAQNEARFQTLFDLMPFSCVVNDMSGRYLLANKYFCKTAQMPLENIMGRTMDELGRKVDPESKKRITAQIKQHGFVEGVEIEMQHDGKMRHILFSSCLIDWKNQTAILSATIDITDRKQAEEAVKQGKENLRVTLNSIGDAVIATDLNGKVTRMNPVAQQLTGWKKEQASGQPLDDVFKIVNARTQEPVESPVRKVLSTGKIVGLANHTMLMARDGSQYQIADSGSPIRNDHGDIIGVVLVFRDVTQEYKMQERLRQAQKMEAIGVLAGGIAHDFNNILSPILGFTDLAKEETGDNETMNEYLDAVSSAGLRARELVRHILAFSRKSEVRHQVIMMSPAIKETLKFIRASLPSNIEIRHDLKAAKAQVWGDPSQFHQILMNLLTNAGHAMKETGGRLEVTLDTLNVDPSDTLHAKLVKPGPYFAMTVSDTGCGIPKLIMDKIFDPFFTTKKREEGTGMGLSTVYGIVKEMGGGIWVYSEPGHGTTFKVLLPDRQSAVPPEKNQAPALVEGQGRILIVDDEDPIVEASQLILSNLGYCVTGAAGSEDALEKIKNDPQYFDLVITDMTMPGMNGLDLSRQIKSMNPDIPILLCTGFSQGMTRETLSSAGIVDLVMKPMIAGELSMAVHKALGAAHKKGDN